MKPTPSRKPTDVAALAFPTVVMLGVGMFMFFILIYPNIRAASARSWPEVPCTIIESRVEQYRDERENRDKPIVRYRYEVNEIPHVGDRIHFGSYQDLGDYDSAHTVRPYPMGMQTTCRVHPRDPEDSVLVPEVRGILMPVVGWTLAIIFLLPLTATIVVWRRYFTGRPLTVPRPPQD